MSDFINIALPKGRLGEKAYKMLKESGYECPSIEHMRKVKSESIVAKRWAEAMDGIIQIDTESVYESVFYHAGKDISTQDVAKI